MRRIIFDDAKLNEIFGFIQEGHTLEQTCNKYNISKDTLCRLMYQHNVKPYNINKVNTQSNRVYCYDDIPAYIITETCRLYRDTHMTNVEIRKQLKLKDYVFEDIIHRNFSEDYIAEHRSKAWGRVKQGNLNPMFGKNREKHHNYKGIVEDGNGYYMVLKPEWYTGRKGSCHVFLHSVVMCEHLGITEIPKGFTVHHIDFDKHNNDISNLALLTISAHSKLHQYQNDLVRYRDYLKLE